MSAPTTSSSYMSFVETYICNVSMNVLLGVGILTSLLLSVLMLINGLVHRRVLHRPPLHHYHNHLNHHHPSIALILPCKGVAHNSQAVWESQLHSTYAGRMELVFVTESKDDAAYAELEALMHQAAPEHREMRLVVAGLSWYNSQKVHNMLAGLRAVGADTEYVFFLDNDIVVNGAAFDNIVHLLDRDDSTLCSTGYSFEVPHAHGSMGSYCIAVFRAIQLLGYITEHSGFLWGGCYMLRRQYLTENVDHYMDMLHDGTYTEDMVLASILAGRHRAVAASNTALFPNVLPKDIKMKDYVAYLRRQYFLLCTYHSRKHLTSNVCQVICLASTVALLDIPLLCWLIQLVTFIPYAILSSIGSFNDSGVSSGVSPYVNMGFMIAFFIIITLLGPSMSFCICSMDKMAATLSNKPRNAIPNPIKMSFASLLHFFIMPVIGIVAPALHSVVWSGIKYVVKDGKISRMYRQDDNGNYTWTEDPYNSMYSTIKEDIKAGFNVLDVPVERFADDTDLNELIGLCD